MIADIERWIERVLADFALGDARVVPRADVAGYLATGRSTGTVKVMSDRPSESCARTCLGRECSACLKHGCVVLITCFGRDPKSMAVAKPTALLEGDD